MVLDFFKKGSADSPRRKAIDSIGSDCE